MNNNYVNHYQLNPGDRIVVPKSSLRMIQHHAIYIGYDHNGNDLIIDNSIGVGVRLRTADEFFSNAIAITRIERFRGGNAERRMAVEKALQKIGQPYNLINYNCEAFANEIQLGIPTSKQVGTAVGAFAGLALLLLLLGSAE